MISTLAVLPKRGSALGFKSWAREMAQVAACIVKPPPYPAEGLPRGDGSGVVVIPGFLTGDWMTGRLRGFLRSLGYRAAKAGVPFNAGPTKAILARAEDAVLRLADETKAPVALVGQSLGGVFARDLAHKHPDVVRCVVTLCSPLQFPVMTNLQPFVRALSWSYDQDWIAGAERIALPPRARVTAIYSESDGLVDWHQCLQAEAPGCRNVHVPGAHATMGANPLAQAEIAWALAR